MESVSVGGVVVGMEREKKGKGRVVREGRGGDKREKEGRRGKVR